MCQSVRGDKGKRVKEEEGRVTGIQRNLKQASLYTKLPYSLLLRSQPGKWEAHPGKEWHKNTEDGVELINSTGGKAQDLLR